jgi:hypothetical protein
MNRGSGLAPEGQPCGRRTSASPRSLAFARQATRNRFLAVPPSRNRAETLLRLAPGLSSRTSAALRPRVRASPPALSRIASGLAASPAPQLAPQRRDQNSPATSLRNCFRSEPPFRTVGRSLRRAEPPRTSFALPCEDCSPPGCSRPALCRRRCSKLHLNVTAPRQAAIAGNDYNPGPLPAGASCRNCFRRDCLSPPAAFRRAPWAAGTACPVPRTRWTSLPTASAPVLRIEPGNRFPGLFRLSPATGRNRLPKGCSGRRAAPELLPERPAFAASPA